MPDDYMAEHHHQQIVLHVMDRDARNHIRDVFDDLENRVAALCRIDTANEVEYFRNGGILQYVLRKLAA